MRALLTGEMARFLRFAIVGGVGFLVDAGFLSLLHYSLGLDPFSSRIISIAIAAFTTWRLNRIITFGSSDRGQVAEGARYATVAGVTAALNYAIYATLLLAWSGLPPVAAAVAATLMAMLFSYAGYSRFVFSGAAATAGASSHRR